MYGNKKRYILTRVVLRLYHMGIDVLKISQWKGHVILELCYVEIKPSHEHVTSPEYCCVTVKVWEVDFDIS